MRSWRRAIVAAGLFCCVACRDEPEVAAVAEPMPRRVVMISIDTLRADHLGTYGYPKETSPVLDALASEKGVVFEETFSQAIWTLPSHMSLLTGLYPDTHGVVHADQRLAPDVDTLAEVLQEQGLATAAFTDNGFMAGSFGFSDGFEVYDDEVELSNPEAPRGLERSIPRIEDWLDCQLDSDFFLFVHTFDVHGPYESPLEIEESFRSEATETEWGPEKAYLDSLEKLEYLHLDDYRSLEDLIAAYDAGIRHTDSMLGRFFQALRDRDLFEDSLIVITSDHGESFLDEGVTIGHGTFLSQAELHVPLIMKFPRSRFARQRIEEVVESIDVMPTILETLGTPESSWPTLQGQSLRPLLHGARQSWDSLAFATHAYSQTWAQRTPDWLYVSPIQPWIVDGYLINYLEAQDPGAVIERLPRGDQLYPAGQLTFENQAPEHPALVGAFQKQIMRWKRAELRLRQKVAKAEQRQGYHEWEVDYLRRLGYLAPSKD
ncbi:MAG: sulfatase [Planctomycetota bacterium]